MSTGSVRDGDTNMICRKLAYVSAVAGTIASITSALSPGAIGAPQNPVDSRAHYKPLASISHEFGSKFMSGYFADQGGRCLITMMIIEKSDPDTPLAMTAARVRLLLNPSQIAGLDSEEGRSINVTCGEQAKTLLVEVGESEKLMAVHSTPPVIELA